MRRSLTILALTLLILCGCGRDDTPVSVPNPPPPATPDESIVVAFCDTLKAAVERFAAENDGLYPENVDADTSLGGHTLLQLLPQAGYENPFTKAVEPPVNGAADGPGEVGYVPVVEGEWSVGYVVTGFGASAIVATLSNLASPEEAKVIANCYLLKQFVTEPKESWETLFGEYDLWPHDWWGRYRWLTSPIIDPYTGLEQCPVSRVASSRGEIGYVTIVENNIPIDYVITGYGDGSVVCVLSSCGYSREEAMLACACRAAQRSAEKHAEENGGTFPDQVSCTSGVSYEPIRMNQWNVGYRITGVLDGKVLLETGTSPEDAKVRLNCLLLKEAVEAFAAENGGLFPETLDMDKLFGGRTTLDLLPRGHLLENPYTGMREEPVNHSASAPGQIGYAMVPEYDDRWCVHPIPPGFVITGFVGKMRQIAITNLKVSTADAIVQSHCRTVQLAVEEFAAHNDGIYPALTTQVNLEGKSVIGYLPNCELMRNPYTLVLSEPGDGVAGCPGQIGYWAVTSDYDENRGYWITGAGFDSALIMSISREAM